MTGIPANDEKRIVDCIDLLLNEKIQIPKRRNLRLVTGSLQKIQFLMGCLHGQIEQAQSLQDYGRAPGLTAGNYECYKFSAGDNWILYIERADDSSKDFDQSLSIIYGGNLEILGVRRYQTEESEEPLEITENVL
jgi:hypothetical protein